MYRLLLSIVFLTVLIQLNAQSLEKKIPKQVGFVVCLNLNSLSQKINFNDLGNYGFLKKPENTESIDPESVIKELFRLPEKGGINKKDKIIIYSENHDSIETLNYLMAISDVKLFQNRMIDILKTKQDVPKFIKEGKIKTLNYNHRMSVGVGKDYALISIWKTPYYYADDYYQYEQERGKIIAIIDSIRYNTPSDTAAATYVPFEENNIVSGQDTVGFEDSTEYVLEQVVVDPPDEDYYDGSYDNDSLMKQFERGWEEKRKKNEAHYWVKHDKTMTLLQKNYSNLKPQDCLSDNKDFSKVFANTADIIYWFNYESYAQQLIDAVSNKYSAFNYDSATYNKMVKNPPVNRLAELLFNNTMYGLGNFDKGEIKMNFYNSFNEVLNPYIQKIYSNNINPEFFKYIKNDNLMGLIGMSINSEAAANLYYEIFRRATESAVVPNKYVVAVIELTDLLLDKNIMYHTFKGDAVVAFTGIKSYLNTYSTSEYDSLTFEYHYVDKTMTKYMPEFVSVMTIENHDNLTRILNMIKRLDGLNEISKNIYSFKSKDQDIDNNFFFVIKGDLFFVTNDKALATEQIMAGLSSDRVVGNTYQSYLNNTSFGFWDASKMFKLMAEGPEKDHGQEDMFQKWSEKINKGFFVTRPLNGNVANSEITIEMKNRENSSLLELLKLFEDMYVLRKIIH